MSSRMKNPHLMSVALKPIYKNGATNGRYFADLTDASIISDTCQRSSVKYFFVEMIA